MTSLCQRALYPSLTSVHDENKHRESPDANCGCSFSTNCRLGADDCRSSGTVRSDIQVLRANISMDPVTLSLLLSELSHGGNKNSRFVSLILSAQPYNATSL